MSYGYPRDGLGDGVQGMDREVLWLSGRSQGAWRRIGVWEEGGKWEVEKWAAATRAKLLERGAAGEKRA